MFIEWPNCNRSDCELLRFGSYFRSFRDDCYSICLKYDLLLNMSMGLIKKQMLSHFKSSLNVSQKWFTNVLYPFHIFILYLAAYCIMCE